MNIRVCRTIAFRNIPLIAMLVLMSCTPAPATVEALITPSATGVPKTATPVAQQEETPTRIPPPASTSFVPKAVFKIVSHSPLFFREARAAGYLGAFLGIDDLNNPALMDRAGPALVEGGGLYFTILNAPANFNPDAGIFVMNYKAQYGASPLLFAARANDATGICIRAIEETSKAKGGKISTRAEVVKAIRALKDYKGITGTYTFNNQGDPTHMQYYVFEVVSVDLTRWDQNSIIASYDVPPR